MTLDYRYPSRGQACTLRDSNTITGAAIDEAEHGLRSAKVTKTNENPSKQLLAPRVDIHCTENVRISSGDADSYSGFGQDVGMTEETAVRLVSNPDGTFKDSDGEDDEEPACTLSVSTPWMGAPNANTVNTSRKATLSLPVLPKHNEVDKRDHILNNSFDVDAVPSTCIQMEKVDHDQNRSPLITKDGREVSEVPQTHAIFALVMGISEYEFSGYENLQGAASDADKFEGYLREDLRVPKENIINLRNSQATRSAIIDGFTSLIRNPNITCGRSAIVIYFAGHGAVANKPDEWTDWETSDNTIEMLCPADMGLLDEDNNVVEGIPDRTISKLLLQLSEAKGDNITFILDCCHAAGINRGMQHPGARLKSRRILHPSQISPNYDSTISSCGSRGLNVTSGFSGSLWDSHIVLAACSRHQSAWEEDGQGIFTRALLKVMRRTPSRGLTYKSLMHRLVMPPFQTPHLEGKHLHRFLFESSGEFADSSRILCRREDGQSHFTLHAGSLHGITKGSTFGIYVTDLVSDSLLLSTAVVDEVGTFVSYLTPSEPTPFTKYKNRRVWYARLIEASGTCLLIHYHPQSLMTLIDETKFTIPVYTIEQPKQADLCLVLEGETIYFERGGRSDSLFKPCVGFSPRFSYVCSIDDITSIRRIIDHYAHFISHLTMTSPFPMSDFATIEMKKLVHVGRFNLCPDGENLLSAVEDGKHIQLDVDTSLPLNRHPSYGFTIQNKSDVDLYAYLFYFDASILEIDAWYSSKMSSSNNERQSVDTCLERNSMLTLGFGNGGMSPFTFTIPDGQDVDVCFFKFFVTTTPVDLGSISRSSPFSVSTLRRGGNTTPSPAVLDRSWASMTVPIIQKRALPIQSKTSRSAEAGSGNNASSPHLPVSSLPSSSQHLLPPEASSPKPLIVQVDLTRSHDPMNEVSSLLSTLSSVYSACSYSHLATDINVKTSKGFPKVFI